MPGKGPTQPSPSGLPDCLEHPGECAPYLQVYWKNEHPRFPDGGKMSQYLESLPIGGEMEVKGPLGHFHYLGRSR